MNYSVYMARFNDDTVYIGMTKDTSIRFNKSQYKAKSIVNRIEKYGFDSIEFEIIVSDISKQLASLIEVLLIREYNRKGNCLNKISIKDDIGKYIPENELPKYSFQILISEIKKWSNKGGLFAELIDSCLKGHVARTYDNIDESDLDLAKKHGLEVKYDDSCNFHTIKFDN